jgi:hypothetical protein
MVFYAVLIAREPFETRQRRCAVHPLKRRGAAAAHPALMAAADATVLLAYGKARDNAADSAFWGRAAARTGLAAMKRAYRRASRFLPETAAAMRENLKLLGALEAERAASIDRPAAAFSGILAALSERSDTGERTKRVHAEVLRHVGRWVYLIDAADDFAEDMRRGLYNPIAARFGLGGSMTEEIKEEMRRTLEMSRSAALEALDLDESGAYTPIVENILLYGLAAAENRVFEKLQS